MNKMSLLALASMILVFSVEGQNTKSQNAKKLDDPRPQNAVESILETFDKYPVVALAEAHRLQEEHDLITALIQHPSFPDKVNDIVVEFGNALSQNNLDRYIDGDNVPLSEVRPVWRNTGFSPLAPWDAPIYEQFFVNVRAINQKLTPLRRLRVLAGDPPVDWTKSVKEINAVKKQNPRDEHFVKVVEKEVFAKGRKALIIMGGGHLYRHSWNPYSGEDAGTAIDLLDHQHPKAVFVIMAHAFQTRNADLEARLASWPKPAFALLKHTWLGAIETDLFMSTTRTEGFGDGKVVTVKINKYLGMTLEDLADAYLYLGDLESLTASYPTPEMYKSDPDYLSEIQRRFGMMSGGRKFPIESLLQARKSNNFYSPPSNTPPPRSASNQDGPKVWAAISVSDPLFQERQTKDLMIHFTLVNGGTTAIDPKQETWRLFINGQELTDSGFIFGNGSRDARWKSLPPGDSLRFSYVLERYFKEPGIYRVSWRGEGFETLPIEFRVMPSKKE